MHCVQYQSVCMRELCNFRNGKVFEYVQEFYVFTVLQDFMTIPLKFLEGVSLNITTLPHLTGAKTHRQITWSASRESLA